MCLYPTLIKNPKYKATKKNGGVIPPITDERVTLVPIGCGECIECRKQKAREWQVRLQEDIKTNTNGKFVTLTFSNESIQELVKQRPTKNWQGMKQIKGYELDNEIATRSTRLFLERWRKKYKKSLRHWLVTELGHNGTENIHIHGIVWTNENMDEVEKIWKYGFVWKGKEENGKIVNYVNEQTINYIVKYVNKVDEQHKLYRSQILTSAGIGNNYTKTYNARNNKYQDKLTDETYRTRTGHKLAMPIYWRNKIYTEEQREQLWLNKLDKNERWVCGEKVNIAETEDEYYGLLEYHRKKNEKLGYGNGQRDWEQEQYERERRILKQKERLNTCRRRGNSKDMDGQNERTKNKTAGRGKKQIKSK